MSKHGNSLENENPHHLYEIRDLAENDVFKYGISDDPIEEDQLSDRIRDQLYYLNLSSGWVRYIGRIIRTDIAGRVSARQVEEEYIETYLKENVKRPKGNPLCRKSNFDPPFPENI